MTLDPLEFTDKTQAANIKSIMQSHIAATEAMQRLTSKITEMESEPIMIDPQCN